MNITTSLQTQVSRQKTIAVAQRDALTNEASTISTVPSWKRAIVRYQRRKANRLAATGA